MKVQTKAGLIDRSELQVKDIIEERENARVTATEWYLNNEMVRRDVNVNILTGLDLQGETEGV
jgi:hypothetical protein